MDTVYRRFESFDFDTNSTFQRGVKSVRLSAERENTETAGNNKRRLLLQMKIFFYNRFVEPITLQGYQSWVSSRDADGDAVLQLGDRCGQLFVTDPADGASVPGRRHGEEAPAVLPAATELDGAPRPGAPAPLSFAEVFQLVRAGEDIPGLEKPDVQPCLLPPTASRLTRRPKPWEKENS
nr:uncharacterized protein C6orf226 homolog [Scleropages formosus]